MRKTTLEYHISLSTTLFPCSLNLFHDSLIRIWRVMIMKNITEV